MEWRFLAGFDVYGSYSYLDAKYNKFTTNDRDFGGNRMLRSPKNSYSFGMSYTHLSNSLGVFIARIDYTQQGDMFFVAANSDDSRIDEFGLVNARLQYESVDDHWKIALWGKNLTDKKYEVFRIPVSDSQSVVPGDPRMIGLSANYTWR